MVHITLLNFNNTFRSLKFSSKAR